MIAVDVPHPGVVGNAGGTIAPKVDRSPLGRLNNATHDILIDNTVGYINVYHLEDMK